jgi:hypothetical protein
LDFFGFHRPDAFRLDRGWATFQIPAEGVASLFGLAES